MALIGSLNEHGTTNLAPICSFWALGWTFLLGLAEETKTANNLRRPSEYVINLLSPEMWLKSKSSRPSRGKTPCLR